MMKHSITKRSSWYYSIGIWLMMFLISCKNPGIFPGCGIELPPLPPAWEEVLGEPRWRLEWAGEDGVWRSWEGPGDGIPSLDLPGEWSSPLLAYPYWPARGISPGTMRPAGAIFPFDAQGSRIRVTWEGGVDAVFYRALAAAWAVRLEDSPSRRGGGERTPGAFDWPRFRELLRGDAVPPEIRRDPWLADWPAIAVKTVEAGFDRRRIRPRDSRELSLALPAPGPWLGTSPFEEPSPGEPGDRVTLGASGEIGALIGPGGMVRYTQDAWIWVPWK